MPVNLSIKAVPDSVADGLRARAARNHRSLQRELMATVETAAAAPSMATARGVEPGPGGRAAGNVADASAVSLRPIEEIFDEWRRLFPRVRKRGPSGTELIRQMRDGRFAELSTRQGHRAP